MLLSEAETTVHVLVSLSSPPLKGLDPILDPDPTSNTKRHHVIFDISAEDSERFRATLQAREIVLVFLPTFYILI